MKSEKNIIFIGFMGCGKTTFGKKISKKLNRKFIDTDKYIERSEKMTITDMFALKGEEYFRNLETKLCEKISKESGNVISTGGGMIKNPKNMAFLKENGIVVYLKTTAEHIYRNIGSDTTRPLLQCDDKLGKIKSLMEERKSLYEKYADITVDVTGSTVGAVTEKICSLLEEE